MKKNSHQKRITTSCNALIISVFLLFSNAVGAQEMVWVSAVLNPLLFKTTTKNAESAINSYWEKYSRKGNYLFREPYSVTRESMPDGKILTIGIYGPEDEPWFVLYSIDGILVKYKILQ